MSCIYLVGTADTKGDELAYLRALIAAEFPDVLCIDLGTREPTIPVDVSNVEIACLHPDGADAVLQNQDRGTAVADMGTAFAAYCRDHSNDIAGIIGIGGGGGTSIVTSGMRELPYGVPKVMVSTLASGDVAPYVDVSDINMFPSITDIAGLNQISRAILHNAAQALIGMVRSPYPDVTGTKKAVGLSMFGVTTPSVTGISDRLSAQFDCLVFHATGTGGRAMERLLADGLLNGLLDITTTEIADLLVGGVLPANEDRLGVVAKTGRPYVGSVGALDMVNFWAPASVPERFKGRQFYHHNPNVTLMRTTTEECVELGHWIADKLNACQGPVRFLIPEKGISALDIEGGEFWDPAADTALFEALKSRIHETENRKLMFLPHHINDPAFSAAAANAFLEINQD